MALGRGRQVRRAECSLVLVVLGAEYASVWHYEFTSCGYSPIRMTVAVGQIGLLGFVVLL